MRAQGGHHLLLADVERGLQAVRGVATVLDRGALAPLANGELAHLRSVGQFGLGAVGLRIARRVAGVAVEFLCNQRVQPGSSSLPAGPQDVLADKDRMSPAKEPLIRDSTVADLPIDVASQAV